MAHPGHHASVRPESAALVMAGTGTTMTWSELHREAVAWGNRLHDAGLRAGDSVAMCLENRFEFVSLMWACRYAGFRFTPISTRLTPAEAGYIVVDCEAAAVVVSARTGANLTAVEERDVAVFDVDGDRFAVADEPRYDRVEGYPMLYSSGTTGRPKGVRRTPPPEPIEELPSAEVGSARTMGIDEDSVYLSTAPLYHSAPIDFLTRMNRLGATTVVMDHFDAEGALAAIERFGVTHSQWVPIMFVRMLALSDDVRAAHDLSSHRWAIHGAGPCSIAVKEAMLDWWGPIIHEYYAGTEGVGMCMIGPEEWLTHKGSVGRSMRGPIHILDEEGHELSPGEVGQIWFENSGDFRYHGDDAKTAEAKTSDGTGTFGDMGYLDDEGYLYLTDRKSFTINVGGINVYPREIEEVLQSHSAVRDVVVFGIPNDEYGEEVTAIVLVAPDVDDGPELAEDLLEHCRGSLASFKLPRSIDFVDDFPREPTGKVRVGELRRAYS